MFLQSDLCFQIRIRIRNQRWLKRSREKKRTKKITKILQHVTKLSAMGILRFTFPSQFFLQLTDLPGKGFKIDCDQQTRVLVIHNNQKT